MRRPPPGFRWLIPLIGSLAVLAAPTPAGLSLEGHRVLAVIVLAIGLWGLETLPPGVTGVLAIVVLVLTMGVAVAKSGLAERVAHVLLARGRGRAGAVYANLLMATPPLTLLLPSATTRTAILVHIYEQALELGRVPRGAPLSRAVMLALNSVNRLASTILLTGGITPVVASGLPVAMAVGTTSGLNPVICGLIVTIAGDAVLYYPAQSASSLVVYERGHLTAGQIFRFGLLMTALATLVVLAVALPYWALVGEPLAP